MRAISNALYTLIVLFGITSTAMAQQCVDTKTPKAQQLTDKSKGVVPVAVVFMAPSDEEYKQASIFTKSFRFWIAGDVALRQDRMGYVREIFRCTFGSTQKTYVRVWWEPIPEETTEAVSALAARVFFPGATVASRPAVGITLDHGTEMKGVWGERVVNGRSIPTLTISAQ